MDAWATKAFELSLSAASKVPAVVNTALASVKVPDLSPLKTAASLVPVMVTVNNLGVPSDVETVMLST